MAAVGSERTCYPHTVKLKKNKGSWISSLKPKHYFYKNELILLGAIFGEKIDFIFVLYLQVVIGLLGGKHIGFPTCTNETWLSQAWHHFMLWNLNFKANWMQYYTYLIMPKEFQNKKVSALLAVVHQCIHV